MRLPPLSSLRGFEAAARLGSFAKAADELCLTQAAVSHQVRSLEKELGQQLFLRLPRELVLTDAGKDFLATVESALQTLSHGMQRLAPYNKTATLIVACDPALARHWLVPGLVGFHAANPDTEVWLDTSEQLTDFDTQEVDVIIDRGVRILFGNGDGAWHRVRSFEQLFVDVGPMLAGIRIGRRHNIRACARKVVDKDPLTVAVEVKFFA